MLTQLKRIVQELNKIPTLDESTAWLVKRLAEVMQVDCCTVYLADYKLQQFTLMATEGLSKQAVGSVFIGFNEGLIGLVGQREEPINIEDAQSHPRFKHYPEVQEEKYYAFLGVPIIHQRKVLGVITVQQEEQRRFSEDEEAFLTTLAAQMALEVVHTQARGGLHSNEQKQLKQQHRTLRGVPGSSGLAIGIGYVPNARPTISNMILRRSADTDRQIFDFRAAVKLTREEVDNFSEKMKNDVAEDVLAIFQLYHHLLDANSLGNEVEEKINAGWDAISALKIVVDHYSSQFRDMNDPYMKERAVDVEDLGNRLLVHLLRGQMSESKRPDEFILIADEVTASMLAEYSESQLKAVISMRGSSNSHAAILARGMGLPAIMGLSDVPLAMLDGKLILFDGYSGELVISPSESVHREFAHLVAEEQELSSIIAEQAMLPAVTPDDCAIELFINTGLSTDIELGEGSEGIGLYRTEIPFMLRERFPSETEQYKIYRSMLEAYSTKLVTMRSLDVGGDKPLPYFPIVEENPFLGWRGIRLTLDHPEIFLIQIRAMLRASIGLNNLQIMLPMITSVDEVIESNRLIKQAYYEVKEEAQSAGLALVKPKVGVMLEVPAVIYQLPLLVDKVDFFSVGSNDLTQYLLAVDRNNAQVADLYDSYHPAVLNALKHIVEQANALSIPISLCGELAGDPGGALLLMAMGYRQLSMNSHNLQKIKWVIRSVPLDSAKMLLNRVLLQTNPADVKQEISLLLESQGLGGLVRAGK
ncbi:phosphoenolpyruvate--protein phosphotransferase [Alteromonadaceae bacterium M269]|nr:phosphoenolpyruvate--protein phosphotransferase [Alteromonadaceae bacterium M269]